MRNTVDSLIDAEGWKIFKDEQTQKPYVIAEGYKLKYTHPFHIHSKLYRSSENPDSRYRHFVAMHDYLWPHHKKTWHYWTEERFRTYTDNWRIMSWAGGANIGKSNDAAKIIIQEFLGDPTGVGAIVASTTLESMKARVWHYIVTYLKEVQIPVRYEISRGMPPKVFFDRDDAVHCISAVAAPRGEKADAIKNYIGRHPKKKMVLLLDECTDLNPEIISAIPNLEAGDIDFQIIAIGNSDSWNDLHGLLSTPKNGVESINPDTDTRWETTQKRGICLYFDAYRSPAVFETDTERKKNLGFLWTKERIIEKKMAYDDVSFWRFVRGFWRAGGTDSTIFSKKFLDEYPLEERAHWLGIDPIQVVAGLDPAFSAGGDRCILQLAYVGTDINRNVVMDFRGTDLTFSVPIQANHVDSVELQITNFVLQKLDYYGCSLSNLAIDASGAGRALGELIKLKLKSLLSPIRVVTVKPGVQQKENSWDIIVSEAFELWNSFRPFVESGQIKGMNPVAKAQLSTRLIVKKGKRLVLEDKHAYKSRMAAIIQNLAHSPDEADTASLCLLAAIKRLGFKPGDKNLDIPKWTPDIEKMVAFKNIQQLEAAQATEQQVAALTPSFRFNGSVVKPKIF